VFVFRIYYNSYTRQLSLLQCSVTCGTGTQSRAMECTQRVVQGMKGEVLSRPDTACQHLGKPLTTRPCVLPQCPATSQVLGTFSLFLFRCLSLTFIISPSLNCLFPVGCLLP
jgi:hypothetical protein